MGMGLVNFVFNETYCYVNFETLQEIASLSCLLLAKTSIAATAEKVIPAVNFNLT